MKRSGKPAYWPCALLVIRARGVRLPQPHSQRPLGGVQLGGGSLRPAFFIRRNARVLDQWPLMKRAVLFGCFLSLGGNCSSHPQAQVFIPASIAHRKVGVLRLPCLEETAAYIGPQRRFSTRRSCLLKPARSPSTWERTRRTTQYTATPSARSRPHSARRTSR